MIDTVKPGFLFHNQDVQCKLNTIHYPNITSVGSGN